jgi:hypothetical protein
MLIEVRLPAAHQMFPVARRSCAAAPARKFISPI